MRLMPSRRRDREGALLALQREINRLFEDFFGQEIFPAAAEGWIPALDVRETSDAIVVKADLPGVEPSGIDVSLTGDVLTIKGEKKEEKEEKEADYHRVERRFGSFSRSVRLPASVDAERVSAEYKNGVLTVTLPKKEEEKGKPVRIEVK